ncbi:hypothetical protein [Mesorhizobium qingshengii]|jgi:hypothetical protein|uniref:hypothetical protein n=1 Tax=Mesorhizobium qingshengii TaxID=1165689 RepID=UPI00115FE228|nr:hypothetical protein [Mesorhizobium qingshengii]
MKKLHPAAAAVAMAVVLALVIRRSGYSSYGPIDTAIFLVFLVFFWWLISDFSGGKGGNDADEATSVEKNFAFRFGRSLSRIFGRR